MLEDRDYMRQPESRDSGWSSRFNFQWSWTVALLVAYVIVFIGEQAMARFAPGNGYFGYLALSRDGLAHGYYWQLITYQFMHAGWLHLLLNCWAIYVFGREMEEVFGGKRFLALVFSSGIVGGVCQMLTAILWPQLFDSPVVGASAGAFGLVAAFAAVFPDRELTMLIFYFIPIQLRAKTLLVFSAVLAVVGIVHPIDNMANAAHLGGMVMGWFFVRKIIRSAAHELTGPVWVQPESEPAAPPLIRPQKSTAEIVANEVDPILDKISAQGIQSLTARERAVLEAARKKMVQR